MKSLGHRTHRRRIPHILGRELCGFWGMFEESYGKPTDGPLPVITPSFVGNSMLPFRCPGCKVIAQELACPVTREQYHDKRPERDNHWCPSCGLRFKLNEQGMPLSSSLKAGAAVGPSKVERNGKTTWQDKSGILWSGANYEALAK